jgi:hypothetical protein
MHRTHTVVWTQRNGTHSEVANKPQYPMITGATLNEWNNMKQPAAIPVIPVL